MVPQFRRRLQSPIKSDKHEITWSQLSQSASSVVSITIAKTVDVGAKGSSTEVAVGSHVYGIYFEFHFAKEDTTSATIIHWDVMIKRPAQTITNPNTYYQDDRSQIIQRGMEMFGSTRNLLVKRILFVRIPKIYQRMKQTSEIQFRYISSDTQLVNACGIAIYKEIY